MEHASIACTDTIDNPWMYAEAMVCPDAADWDTACEDKICTFQQWECMKLCHSQRVQGYQK